MRRIKRFFGCFTGLFLTFSNAVCQDSDALFRYQTDLVRLGKVMFNEPSEPERLKANFEFVKILVKALQVKNSFDFGFDSLNMVSILPSQDQKLRIFSWHIPLNDGSFLYYGSIQMNTNDGQLKLIPLLDKTFEIGNPTSSINRSSDWYGSQYYDIIPIKDYYVLLGWKGHSSTTTQKVIDVLSFDENSEAILGKSIFKSDQHQLNTRIIFKFAKEISMYLSFDVKGNRILHDHLVPSKAEHIGDYQYYGPDLSFNGWQIEGHELKLLKDIYIEIEEN